MERELEALTRRDLLQLASELKVTGRNRMRKDELMQAILVARIYRSIPESSDILQRLTRKDLLRMCEWIGVEAKKGARKGDLVERIIAEKVAGKPEGHPRLKDLRLPGKGERETGGPSARFATRRPPMVNGILPDGYGETRIVLLPVDPYLVHVYWELSGGEKMRVRRLLEDDPSRFKAVLRFHDVTGLQVGGFHRAGSFDVDVRMEPGNWYVRLLSPEKTYIVDLGLRGSDGRFHPIVRSNRAGTPRAWPCEEAGDTLMRVVEWTGGIHVDPLAGRQPTGDPTPISQPVAKVAKGPQVRPFAEGHRAVVGLPSVRVGTPAPEGSPQTKPSHRLDEAVEEPLFGMEEESSPGNPARTPSYWDKRQESRGLRKAGPNDAGYGPRTKTGETFARKEGKGLPLAERSARSGAAPRGEQRLAEVDLSLWCEEEFVSGLSSKQMTRAENEDDQD